MANTNMRKELADVLTLGGCAQFNVKVREKFLCQNSTTETHDNYRPAWAQGVPFFYNESNLAFVNRKARAAGVTKLLFSITREKTMEKSSCLTTFWAEQEKCNNQVTPATCGNRQVPMPKVCQQQVKEPLPWDIEEQFHKKVMASNNPYAKATYKLPQAPPSPPFPHPFLVPISPDSSMEDIHREVTTRKRNSERAFALVLGG